MKTHTDLLTSRVKEIHEEVIKDLTITDMNIKEKTLECPALKTKWLMLYLSEKKYLETLEKALEQKKEEYVEKHGKEGIPKVKTRSEADDDISIKKVKKAIYNQKEVVEFLEGLVKITSGLNFDLKNSIDILKMESM